MRLFRSALLLTFLLSSFVTLPACSKPEDEVRAQYEASEAAIAAQDMAAYRNTLSTASIQHIEATLELARRCPAAQTKKLPCEQMEIVIALRNRVPADKLKKMQVLDYLQWMQTEGRFIVDAEFGLVPYKFTITGDKAQMQYGIKTESQSSRPRFGRRGLASAAINALSGSAIEPIEGMYVHFERINGFWYHDLTQPSNPNYDQECAEEAKAAQMSLPDYMAALEKEANDGKLNKNVWSPIMAAK